MIWATIATAVCALCVWASLWGRHHEACQPEQKHETKVKE